MIFDWLMITASTMPSTMLIMSPIMAILVVAHSA
jgi:hypothetical protein